MKINRVLMNFYGLTTIESFLSRDEPIAAVLSDELDNFLRLMANKN
jgi:hypothetical protein